MYSPWFFDDDSIGYGVRQLDPSASVRSIYGDVVNYADVVDLFDYVCEKSAF